MQLEHLQMLEQCRQKYPVVSRLPHQKSGFLKDVEKMLKHPGDWTQRKQPPASRVTDTSELYSDQIW